MTDGTRALLETGIGILGADDPELAGMLEREIARQQGTLSMVASSSLADPSVLAAFATPAVNVTAEGYPGRRFHAGCAVVDEIEALAIRRTKAVFGAEYVNVQPHSATTANYTVLSALMRPGDTLLGMDLRQGGHLTHGSPAAYSGRYFNAVNYGLGADGRIDFREVHDLARRHRPRVIVCGATSYPRGIDFARFREIADDVGAYLLADISHTALLVAHGLHPNPVPYAHVTTTCTHKQLFGPRGGLILCGPDASGPGPDGTGTLAAALQRAVFPFSQGAPVMGMIAAKARALAIVGSPAMRRTADRIVDGARSMARILQKRGCEVVTGGTDNHIVLLDLRPLGLSGLVAERALEQCHITVNKNAVPHDPRPAAVTSGLRIGLNGLAHRGMDVTDVEECAELLHHVLTSVVVRGDRDGEVPDRTAARVRRDVAELCGRFPLPMYPAAAGVTTAA